MRNGQPEMPVGIEEELAQHQVCRETELRPLQSAPELEQDPVVGEGPCINKIEVIS